MQKGVITLLGTHYKCKNCLILHVFSCNLTSKLKLRKIIVKICKFKMCINILKKDLEFRVVQNVCEISIYYLNYYFLYIILFKWLLTIYGFRNWNWNFLGLIEKSHEWKVRKISNMRDNLAQEIDPHITTIHIRVERSVLF
jgi:hypothetical protein